MKNLNPTEMGKNSKDKDYTHCTISTEYGDYIAQVQFNEIIDAWEPIYVLVDGEWMSIDDFDDTEMGLVATDWHG